ncbi:hypothetical protein M3Y97_00980200 [Aphelenchoides bicaudatus]|nr:hypothetical protein M3Y97_00980200 [Aphelenchoides bicaudatus]
MATNTNELDGCIKMARTTLTTNGSEFVFYETFLEQYRKDHKSDFEDDAMRAGYGNGIKAFLGHKNIFEWEGGMVRRTLASSSKVSHIINAIDGSRSRKQRADLSGYYHNGFY